MPSPSTAVFSPYPAPATPLGVHRILSPTSGLRVSPLCLGGMSIGDAWSDFMGSTTKEDAFKLLDAFYKAGGNFIDTSPNYQNEQSEAWIGEWMEARGVRDQIVLATKYTTNYVNYKFRNEEGKIASNYGGNHNKSLHLALRDSLKRLRTDYIDILYLHWWDWSTSVEEVMRSLNAVVQAGKVLYLGVSDTPAWVVSKANQYARDHALTPFVIYQGQWSIMLRSFERDIIPMTQSEGMALAPWGAIGGGRFQTKEQLEKRKQEGDIVRGAQGISEEEAKISAALEKVANELGKPGEYSITAVALAYVLQRATYVFPIIGGRRVSHLEDNIKALTIKLSDEQIKYLESQTTFDIGFPLSMIGEDPHRSGETQFNLVSCYANLKWVKHAQPITQEKQ